MQFRHLSLKVKLWIFSGFFLGVFAFASVFAVWVAEQLGAQTEDLAQVHVPSVRKMTLVDMMHDGLRAVVLEAYIVSKDKSASTAEIKKEAEEKVASMREYISDLEKIPMNPATKALVEQSVNEVKKYTELAELAVNTAIARDFEKFDKVKPEFQEEFEVLEEKLGKLGDQITAEAAVAQKAGTEQASKAVQFLLLSTFLLLITGIAAAYLFIKSIMTRINPLMKMVSDIGQGHYEHEIEDQSKDEIGTLTTSVFKMGLTIGQSMQDMKIALADAERATELASEESKKATQALEIAKQESAKAKEASAIAVSESEKAKQSSVLALAESEKANQALAQAATEAERAKLAQQEAEEKSQIAASATEEAQRALQDVERNRLEAMKAQEQAKSEAAKVKEMMLQQEQANLQLKNKIDSILSVVFQASQGDYSRSILVHGNEPIDDLALQLNQLFAKVNESLNQISQASSELISTSGQFVDMNSELANLTSKTEDIAGKTLELSQVVKQESAQLNRKAEEIKDASDIIKSVALETQMSSDEVFNKSKGAEQVISQLVTVSNEISQFTQVISRISAQTNLLALNATIEAARAGEAGKGFAVVANEVKELAMQTRVAADNVDNQVKGVVEVVHQVENSMKEISDISQRMKAQFAEVNSSISSQSDSTNLMFDLIRNSAQKFEAMNQNLSNVKSFAEANSSSAKTMWSEAKQLTNLGQQLGFVVDQFKGAKAADKYSNENQNGPHGFDETAA